jgi:hypothetical protein
MSKFNPNAKRQLLLPKWVGNAALIATPFGLAGVALARFTASSAPNSQTGQTYQIYFAKSQSYWYLDFWQMVIYRALTIPTLCVWLVAAGFLLYGVGRKYWFRRHQ